MSATPNVQAIWDAIRGRFPDVDDMGVYNCRYIGNDPAKGPSQHAATEIPPGYRGNAVDVTSPYWRRLSTREQAAIREGIWRPGNPNLSPAGNQHYAYLNRVHAAIITEAKLLGIRLYELIWLRRNHYDHIHYSTYPRLYGRPPCMGGRLVVRNFDGTFDNTFGTIEEDEPVLTQGAEGKTVRDAQRGLWWFTPGDHLAGDLVQNWTQRKWRLANDTDADPTLPVWDDSQLGPGTADALRGFQDRRDLPVSGNLDSMTYAKLLDILRHDKRPKEDNDDQ